MTVLVISVIFKPLNINTEGFGDSKLVNLYNGIVAQNKALQQTIYELNNTNVNTEKVFYQNQQIYNLAYVNKYLIILYFILVVVVGFLLFKKEGLNKYMKFAFFMLFLSFPFFIGPLENLILNWLTYLYDMINGIVYTSNNY